jgi:uncharacterized membrane protein
VTWLWVLVLDSDCVVLLVLEEITDSYAFSSSLLLSYYCSVAVPRAIEPVLD